MSAKQRLQVFAKLKPGLPKPLDMVVQALPGPAGELNRLSYHPRGVVLCLGPTAQSALEQRW